MLSFMAFASLKSQIQTAYFWKIFISNILTPLGCFGSLKLNIGFFQHFWPQRPNPNCLFCSLQHNGFGLQTTSLAEGLLRLALIDSDKWDNSAHAKSNVADSSPKCTEHIFPKDGFSSFFLKCCWKNSWGSTNYKDLGWKLCKEI